MPACMPLSLSSSMSEIGNDARSEPLILVDRSRVGCFGHGGLLGWGWGGFHARLHAVVVVVVDVRVEVRVSDRADRSAGRTGQEVGVTVLVGVDGDELAVRVGVAVAGEGVTLEDA